MRRLFLSISMLIVALNVQASSDIKVLVDPRVELMSIVMRLAGAQEYRMARPGYAYASEVDAYFAPYKNHEAIKTVQSLRRQYGVSYDAPMSLAVHLDNYRNLKPLVDLAHPPSTFDGRWKPKPTADFLVKLRSFVKASKFEQFLKSHRDFYAKSEKNLSKLVGMHDLSGWFDRFYGPRKNAELYAVVGLLNGGANYGVSAQLGNNRLVVSPVLGVYLFDPDGTPKFSDTQIPTLVHEFSHTYMNPLVMANMGKIAKSAETMYEANAKQFQSQAYGSGQTVACETMVRVASAIFCRDCLGEGYGKIAVNYEINRGFWWVDGFVKLFDEYKDRTKYKTMADFMPRIVDYFNSVPSQLQTLKERMPQVVSVSPSLGPDPVPSNTTELVITFSKPIVLGFGTNILWVNSKPLEVGKLAVSDSKMSLRLKVKLEPNKSYSFLVQGITSEEGFAASMDVQSFKTGS